MLVLLVLLLPLYLGVVWVLSRLLCREAMHRKSHVGAGAVALLLAGLIGSFGVPYAHNPQDRLGVVVAGGVLALGPVLLPRLGLRTRIWVALALLGVFTEPVVRVEYLTWRHGQALRQAFAAEHPVARQDRLFSVLAYSRRRAEVLRVEADKTGYLMDFERNGDELWRVAPASYPPQQLLWYYGNSGWYDCPYPTSILLVLHGTGAWCG